MSAEKCGEPTTVELVELALKRASLPPEPKQVAISSKASRMLDRIRHKFPDFDPQVEAEVWVKARKMGLTEEE